ncbi:MAG: tryptophan 2,3-dioxygenase [Oligoflexia bacterium]|nr:tryptophan 2,3-dioxygenase [Oligoflexia bacterium]
MSKSARPLDYLSYLKIDELLTLQDPISFKGAKPAHDEMMYIVLHQAYELWFKLIIFELESVIAILDHESVDERDITRCVARFKRMSAVQQLLLQQFQVLETMTPLDFLDFRGLLGSASGFQSFQFRLLENRIGIDPALRLNYGNMTYSKCFEPAKEKQLVDSEKQPSLFSVLEKWLARTPFLDQGDFHFLESYEKAVLKMLGTEVPLSSHDGSSYAAQPSAAATSAFYTQEQYEKLRASGAKRLSWRATLAALFISLYRDEPILHQPFRLIESIIDFDENFALWRYKHALVVHKMLGKRTGTGGSSGFDYLRATVEKHRVFSELFDVATLLIPRSDLPDIPEVLKKRLDFRYSSVD